MWFEWGVRLTAILALLIIVSGMLVLGLPDELEGEEIVRLDNTHSLRLADLVGAGLIGTGALATWVTVLAWQRKRLEE